MHSFRLITEGVTDQKTLEIILSIFYDDPDIDIERLQPPGDETDKYKQKDYGGWGMVFDYLQRKEFKEAITFADYFIIQIDTDVSPEFGIPHQEAGIDLTPEELYKRVKEKLISKMDGDFYDKHKERFIFAISIHSIECWFLPLYYDDNRKSKLINCLDTLNQRLKSQESFTIERKSPRYYETISKKFKTKKKLVKLAANSPSFKMFLENLPDSGLTLGESD
ncbi:MAG TPA: phage tail protein [Candidatus Kapabacteria bacterium]|nr:phage tail protein [Candidatus Kapabacteria bacterium]